MFYLYSKHNILLCSLAPMLAFQVFVKEEFMERTLLFRDWKTITTLISNKSKRKMSENKISFYLCEKHQPVFKLMIGKWNRWVTSSSTWIKSQEERREMLKLEFHEEAVNKSKGSQKSCHLKSLCNDFSNKDLVSLEFEAEKIIDRKWERSHFQDFGCKMRWSQ